MRRAIGVFVILIFVGAVLPPAYYGLAGESEAVELPPPGRIVQHVIEFTE
jgi:hypothetical protein